ncbi:TPR-like protein [Hypoxylon trugodes]|uniref:TPR-like protein n=1 Tax=Hypoxylon trugodes TaxID=326681 RepID=UPI0021A16AAC|nr:TPR-like protein [Hypoxylon trugodes]KAI1384666.1 TPR-like protein [Hypoxylon trugodes]
MSHRFSSTFDALQAHFTKKPDAPGPQPGNTTTPQGQNTNPSQDNATQNSARPMAGATPQAYPVQPSSAVPVLRPDGRRPLPGVPPIPHTLSGRGPPILPRPSGFGTGVGAAYRAIVPGPPARQSNVPPALAVTQNMGFHSNGGSVHFPSPQMPQPFSRPPVPAAAPVNLPFSITNQMMAAEDEEVEAEDEPEPMDITTDALLERQNILNSENPMPKFPAGRGFIKKYLMEDKPKRPRSGGNRATKKRGPRKAAEPTGDIKYRLNMASNAYMDGRIDEAIEFVNDAIRINAETYRAWILLASFLQEKGNKMGHYTARFCAANLQPKVMDDWLQCAELAIGLRDEFPEESDKLLEQAAYCYTNALKIDMSHEQAHHGRAALHLEAGRLRMAAKDYVFLIEHCPYDVYALRGLAEVRVLLADTGKAKFAGGPSQVIEAYRKCIAHFRENGFDSRFAFEWEDVKIFVELLAYVERFGEAIQELRSLSRWLLNRSDEGYWDNLSDDREWDVENTRRVEVEEYQEEKCSDSSYGGGLPLELRTKLAVYRFKLGQVDEAMRHLEFIDPDKTNTADLLTDYPHLVLEGASALYEAGYLPEALRFYEPLREPDLLDTESLVRAGQCYLHAGDKREAEECFAIAIDQDESNSDACIDARYELAKMYEAAREEREAYILVNEAIKLQEARDQAQEEEDKLDEELGDDNDEGQEGAGDIELPASILGQGAGTGAEPKTKRAKRPLKPKAERPRAKPKERKPRAQPNPTRRRLKLFGRAEELQVEERRRAAALAEAWETVRKSRALADGTAKTPSDEFMAAARELVYDFRSYKEFYQWDKYLAHLGIHQAREMVQSRKGNSNLVALAERLAHNLNPDAPGNEKQTKQVAVGYRNVPFNEWLDLFLEFAIGLAQNGKFQESYKVCEAARDTTIFSKSKEDMFLIHVTWAACALRGRDEETCVACARWIMREFQYDTDPFRMFASLSRLCPSPASWYASGPVQKYMLRQIKLMDRAITAGGGEDSGDEDGAPSGRVYQSKELDITLLMLYGHILFISNSFTYALNYFMRAYTLDPTNSMVILSVGHCYVHYALKRQAENRQYLLVQGFHFLHQYYELRLASPDAAQRQEAHYNLARSYHAIGIPHLAAEYYRRVLQDVPNDEENGIMGRNDLTQEAAYNLQQICWTGGDVLAAKGIAEKFLVL